MFCENFKNLRLSKKMTQEELAKNLGMAKSTISMYELGLRTPDLETLELIADFFNVRLDELVSPAPDGISRSRKLIHNLVDTIPEEDLPQIRDILANLIKLSKNG